ncbi:hypothetical protein [Nonlabens marinus]|uniref:Lipoprotein n=1 Tax=Nonlabens marinus S1-08 TaxID=1454201 RepID=W8VQ01_9FLAO|nr:hypothetical protein [Nonlabens marinus]BAO54755.1 hypothetical protein NMS_0746 [Nonlabens marinus S1-08]
MKFLSLFAFVVLTSSCCSQKIDSTVGPFENGRQPYAQSWTGGIPGSGSGVNLFMPGLDIKADNIDRIYFQGMITDDIEVIDSTTNDLVARFKTDFNSTPDANMNLDPKKEYGNQAPTVRKDFPFKLKDDEMVVKFIRNGKTYHTKFIGVARKSAMDLPSKPQ